MSCAGSGWKSAGSAVPRAAFAVPAAPVRVDEGVHDVRRVVRAERVGRVQRIPVTGQVAVRVHEHRARLRPRPRLAVRQRESARGRDRRRQPVRLRRRRGDDLDRPGHGSFQAFAATAFARSIFQSASATPGATMLRNTSSAHSPIHWAIRIGGHPWLVGSVVPGDRPIGGRLKAAAGDVNRGGPSAAPIHFPPTDRKPRSIRSCTGCLARSLRVGRTGLTRRWCCVVGQAGTYRLRTNSAIPRLG